MKASESRLQIRHGDKDKVVIGRLINQAEATLIGGIWTDQQGKIHYVGLTQNEAGYIVPDFPRMEDIYIADVAQVGLRK